MPKVAILWVVWENDWYGNENSVTNAIKYYTLAGDIGYCLGYIRAGDIYNENSELSAYINPDSKKANKFYNKAKDCYKIACKNGDKASCEELKLF
ncbi:hypothetical protein [Campylobacter sp. MG1]|uniref:hypothetical protein n=1 Tax=Campylobacter sp. MG1 TaxID=2976332 RepID=UPI00226CB5D4|nr:hypothetical protein [Campylobacter sp. MG1]